MRTDFESELSYDPAPRGQGRGQARSSAGLAGVSRLRHRQGFTLIEIMIVVGIMAIVLTMGVPLVYQLVKKEPFRKAMSDIEQICMEARRRAILHGKEVSLVFYADGRIEISGGAAGAPANAEGGAELPAEMPAAQPGGSAAGAVRLSENIGYELLSVDHIDYLDRDQMAVSFRPNGTCDEMVLVLLSDKNERAKIWLEVTTGLVNVETDPRRF